MENNNNKKKVQICALVIFIIFIFIAVGSSTASVVLFLFNPIQQITKSQVENSNDIKILTHFIDKLHFNFLKYCDNDWNPVGFPNSCYKKSTTAMNWSEAVEFCNGIGGNLAQIDSEEEQLLIEQILDPNFRHWIGLNDINVEGQFEWTKTPEVIYTNWDNGEPNNQGDEDCALIRSKKEYGNNKWIDYPCGYSSWQYLDNLALCEK